MAISTLTKRGRKPRPYVTAAGIPIPGLARRPSDGRWRIVETGFTFTEPNEARALERFHELTGDEQKVARISVATVSGEGNTISDALKRKIGRRVATIIPTTRVTPEGNVEGRFDIFRDVDEAAAYRWFAERIHENKERVAMLTGIAQIAWLDDLKRPTTSPTLKEIGELYAAKPGLSTNEAGRSRLFWSEFTRACGVERVREITHECVAAYETKIRKTGLSPKSMLHRFRKVRTILAYSIKRGRGVEDCRKALDITAMLEVKEHTPLDPRPIAVDDFWKIYAAAEKAEDKTFAAMLLLALNAALYPGEVAAVKWEELDLRAGTFATRRSKTGVSRVACLWAETVRALKDLPRRGDYVFNTKVRSYTVFSALDSWRKYRTAAKLGDEIVFSMIRDAAFTIACRASTLDQARVLAGHRLPGASDHYIRRAPQFVVDACRAIRAEFYAK
ncbi:MAG TPA: tyrosine-type recombinase/integrase [Tepidisphaeraceae bacterium]|nr:tyrosine-type recombinase/integrase [Tepidisphaeraceae bacterium]